MIIRTTKRDDYSMLIPPTFHKELHKPIIDIQRKTNTRIFVPGDRQYDKFNDPIDIFEKSDPKWLVKIVGTEADFAQAVTELNNELEHLQQTTRVLTVPLKFQTAIHGYVRKPFFDMDVHLSCSIAIDEERPIPPLPDGRDWQVIERYHNYADSSSEWTLRAQLKDLLDQAEALIEKAVEKARLETHIGFLLFPDSSKFGLIIGTNGTTIKTLQNDTNTKIHVPKASNDPTIEITGSAADIENAKMRIKSLVHNDPPSPTDRLFRSSRITRMNSSTNSRNEGFV